MGLRIGPSAGPAVGSRIGPRAWAAIQAFFGPGAGERFAFGSWNIAARCRALRCAPLGGQCMATRQLFGCEPAVFVADLAGRLTVEVETVRRERQRLQVGVGRRVAAEE